MIDPIALRKNLSGALLCAAALWSAPCAPATPSAAAPFELVVLGSGGPGATGRASSSYLALVDGVPRILIDAGSGAFVRIGEANLSLAQADIVLRTHLHADHAAELPGLFKARAVSSSAPITFKVFGPPRARRGDTAAPIFPRPVNSCACYSARLALLPT